MAASFAVASPLAAQNTAPVTPGQVGPVIESISFEGNRRMRSETLMARILDRAGDPYNEDTLKRDFHALWNTQYFEDIRLEVQDNPKTPNAKIVIFHVVERPLIRRIDYRGLKSVSQSDVLDRFRDKKVGLSVESQFDPTKIIRAEVAIKDLLSEHGRQFAIVRPTYEKIPATNAVKLVFQIEEGPKVKVGTIIFQGNTHFSDRKLVRSMHNSRPYAIPLHFFAIPVLSKTFDSNKLDQDLELGVRSLYQDNGYYKVVVGTPILKTEDVGKSAIPIPLLSHKDGKATSITIPIEEGEQYRMGRLVIRSSDPEKPLSLRHEVLESMFPLKQGDIFAFAKVRKAYEDYTKLYGAAGYIDFTAQPTFDAHDDTKVIDLTFDFDEQKRFYVRRIDFSGNVTTRDKVIRRELLINEGQVFNNRAWETSLLRLNQLDYFNKIDPKDAEIKRNQAAATVDILLKVKEKGKQSISLTGGVSGLAGGFIGLSYQTNNFLGLGETLTFSTQFGNLERSFLFGFTEPYLFDRPISTGFTISSSRYSFNQSQQASLLVGQKVQIDPNIEQDYNQNTSGFTIFASYPVRKFSFARVGLNYGYTNTSISSFSSASTLLFETLSFQSLAGPSALKGIRSSSITPSITYNTVDNPINPSTGKEFFYSLNWQGLGGNVRAISNVFDAKYFRPINRQRYVLAFHFTGSFVTGYAGRAVPPYQRLYLGGESDIRGFDVRTVTPIAFIPVATATGVNFFDPTKLDAAGNPTLRTISIPTLNYQISFPGGDTEGVFNAEYRIPIAGPVSVSLFGDVGLAGVLRHNQLQLDPSGYSNLLSQFPGKTISSTLQIQPGTNFHTRMSTGVEFVVQLPIVNAPFRLYWAYNPFRLSQQIVAPRSEFNLNGVVAPPDVMQNIILPQLQQLQLNPQRINFFEPKSTFRFTVSRTF